VSDDISTYLEAAERIARAAGDELLRFHGRVQAFEKAPGDLLTEADLSSQRLIQRQIAEAFPDHTLLAEEEQVAPDPSRPDRWIVDPLDGTINFAHGFPFWCVSIALERRGMLVVGVVHEPLTGRTHTAARGRGAFRDGRPIRVSATDRLERSLIAAAFPTRFEADAERQLALMGRFSTRTHSVRRTGSTALNLAWLAGGAFDVAFGTSVNAWDVAAGVLILQEAGGRVTRLDGGAYDLYGSEILATNGQVHASALEAVAAAVSDAKAAPRSSAKAALDAADPDASTI